MKFCLPLSPSALVLSVFVWQYCDLGRLSHEVGWKYKDVVEKLEMKRKAKCNVYYKKVKTDKVSFSFF